jgi:uncharacterized protein (DUF1778 family)
MKKGIINVGPYYVNFFTEGNDVYYYKALAETAKQSSMKVLRKEDYTRVPIGALDKSDAIEKFIATVVCPNMEAKAIGMKIRKCARESAANKLYEEYKRFVSFLSGRHGEDIMMIAERIYLYKEVYEEAMDYLDGPATDSLIKQEMFIGDVLSGKMSLKRIVNSLIEKSENCSIFTPVTGKSSNVS